MTFLPLPCHFCNKNTQNQRKVSVLVSGNKFRTFEKKSFSVGWNEFWPFWMKSVLAAVKWVLAILDEMSFRQNTQKKPGQSLIPGLVHFQAKAVTPTHLPHPTVCTTSHPRARVTLGPTTRTSCSSPGPYPHVSTRPCHPYCLGWNWNQPMLVPGIQ